MKPYTILCMGDLQVGHRTALWPPDFTVWDGGKYTLNVGQQYLWECWMDMIENRLPRKLDMVINMGETIEGPQKKEEAVPLITADLELQAEAAQACLKPLMKKAEKSYFLGATHYHEGPSHIAVKPVAKHFKAKTTEWGSHIWDDVLVTKYGVRMHFQHACPVFKVYRGTMMEREMVWSRLAEAVKVYGDINIVVRAHVHNHIYVATLIGSELRGGFTIPGWQLQTEYVTRFSRFRTLSHIGAVLIKVWPDREPPFDVIPIGYDYPVKEVIKL